MIHQTQYNFETIWGIIKDVRTSFMENIDPDECGVDYKMPQNEYISKNINKVEEKFEFSSNSNNSIFENVSQETFEEAFKMYTFLNFCPPKMKYFYTEIFKNASPKNMISALAGLLKTSRNAAEKEAATKIFPKLMEKLKLTYYKSIDLITGMKYVDDFYDDCVTNAVDLQSCNNSNKILGFCKCLNKYERVLT